MKRCLFIALLLICQFLYGQNLIINPGAEVYPTSLGWTQLSGFWTTGTEVPARSGSYHFYSGDNSGDGSELYQDIDVSSMAASIDAGGSTFHFSVWMRVYNFNGVYNDRGQAFVEYRNASNTVLQTYSTGILASLFWTMRADSRVAPVGTRTIRIRLVAYRYSGTAADGYFDDLVLTHESTLPVNLLSFSSKVVDNTIEVNWQTSKEESNNYFTLEKSVDGYIWKEISKQNGAIRSDHTIAYKFTDMRPTEGVQYYRLKQTDLNGSITTFPAIAQEYKTIYLSEISLFPNPADDYVTISIPFDGEKKIRVFSLEGRLPIDELFFEGNQYTIDLNQLQAGYYFIEISFNNTIERKKLKIY